MFRADKKMFPLEEAYEFATSQGLTNEVHRIREMETRRNWSRGNNHYSDVRRGYLIELFKQNDLLDQFKQHWPRGIGIEGEAECRRCLRIKATFDQEVGGARLSFTSRRTGIDRIESASNGETLATRLEKESRLDEDHSGDRTANTTLMEDLDEVANRNIEAAVEATIKKATAVEVADAFDDLESHKSELDALPPTEREEVRKSRVGQGKFRKDLIAYWQSCAVTGCTEQKILRASHIQPWRDSDNRERLDPFNGLLLAPHLDALFDAGFVSFADSGRILRSTNLSDDDYRLLGIHDDLKLRPIDDRHKKYLHFHREMHGFGQLSAK